MDGPPAGFSDLKDATRRTEEKAKIACTIAYNLDIFCTRNPRGPLRRRQLIEIALISNPLALAQGLPKDFPSNGGSPHVCHLAISLAARASGLCCGCVFDAGACR